MQILRIKWKTTHNQKIFDKYGLLIIYLYESLKVTIDIKFKKQKYNKNLYIMI